MSSRVLAGIVVLCGFLRGNAICAQQDSNLQPLAPEATRLSISGQNEAISEASINRSANAPGRALILPVITLTVAHSLDLHSTWKARSSGRGIEGNPVMDVPTGGQIAIKAGALVGIVYVAQRVHRRHPTAAKIVLYGTSALTFAVSARNYRIAAR